MLVQLQTMIAISLSNKIFRMERVSEMERGQKQRIWQKVKSNIAVLCLKFSLKNPLELRHKNVSAAASLKLKQNFYLFLPMLGDVCA